METHQFHFKRNNGNSVLHFNNQGLFQRIHHMSVDHVETESLTKTLC